MPKQVILKKIDQQEYTTCWQNMKTQTNERTTKNPDEFWIVQHPPVFTLGQAGKIEHILNAHEIPIVKSDRGGQVTYHGPGQIVLYVLVDIKRLGLGARALVNAIENSIICTLEQNGIKAFSKKEAPGVYVNEPNSSNDAKIAALGLRIRKGCSYHGLSVNFDMDLSPFSYINPCGYEGQAVTQVSSLNNTVSIAQFEQQLVHNLCEQLKLNMVIN